MPRNARTSLYQNFSASPGGKCYHLSISHMVLHWKFLPTHLVLVSLCSLKSVLVVFCLNASIGECRTREKLSTVTTPFLQQKLLSIKKASAKKSGNSSSFSRWGCRETVQKIFSWQSFHLYCKNYQCNILCLMKRGKFLFWKIPFCHLLR